MLKRKEAAIGIEPMDKGFADLCLTTWLRRLILVKRKAKAIPINSVGSLRVSLRLKIVERETGFEPATSTLARSHSTAELLPLEVVNSSRAFAILSTLSIAKVSQIRQFC